MIMSVPFLLIERFGVRVPFYLPPALFPAILHAIAADARRTTCMMNMALMMTRSSLYGDEGDTMIAAECISGRMRI